LCAVTNTKEYTAAWRAKNRERIREQGRTWYAANRERVLARARSKPRAPRPIEGRMLRSARDRALLQGLPFSITVADVSIPARCPVLGMPLKQGRGPLKPASPSLDRIVPALGYVSGNVQVISHLANSMKGAASQEQLLSFARWVFKACAKKEG
jgi:hypothetical protein